AAGQEVPLGRADGDRHVARRPAAPPPLMRLVAVLGYSPRRRGPPLHRRRDRLHDVCAARVQHARALVRDGDGVLLTGEAELMRGAWAGEDLLLDPHARNTRENGAAVAAAG